MKAKKPKVHEPREGNVYETNDPRDTVRRRLIVQCFEESVRGRVAVCEVMGTRRLTRVRVGALGSSRQTGYRLIHEAR